MTILRVIINIAFELDLHIPTYCSCCYLDPTVISKRRKTVLLLFAITDISRLMQDLAIVASFSEYAIPKIKMLCNLRCVKVRLRLRCIKKINGKAAQTSFQDRQSYVTFMFSELRIN